MKSLKVFRKQLILLTVIVMVLTLALGFGSLAQADPGYYYVTNPVFYSVIDGAGGAWDTVTWYQKEMVDLLSGNWRANLRIGGNQAWIEEFSGYWSLPSVTTTPSEPGDLGYPSGVRSITSIITNNAVAPYGLNAGDVTIEMDVRSIQCPNYLGLRDGSLVVGEPWIMQESYTVINTSDETLENVAFFMYYFPSPYGWYPTNIRPSHVDYAPSPDPMGYLWDITHYGEGGPNWAYTALSTNMLPAAHDVGHGGGYPDPPYYTPSPPLRPSAIATDVLRQVENDALRGWPTYDAPSGPDPNAVAGALKWDIGSLEPYEKYTLTFHQSVAPHDAEIHTWRMEIDIKPGSFPNSINLKNKGVIPVAILTTPAFDASTIDPMTVRFGRAVEPPAPPPPPPTAEPVQYALEDVDGDGDIDMILHFKTEDTGIQPGDTMARIIGQTIGGLPIIGRDSIRTVPPK